MWPLCLHCKWQHKPMVSDNSNVIFICALQNKPFYDVHAARAGFRNVSSLEVKYLMSILLVFLGQLLPAPKQWHVLPLRLLPVGLPHAGLWHGDRPVSLQTRCHRAPVQPLWQPLRWGHPQGLWRWAMEAAAAKSSAPPPTDVPEWLTGAGEKEKKLCSLEFFSNGNIASWGGVGGGKD